MRKFYFALLFAIAAMTTDVSAQFVQSTATTNIAKANTTTSTTPDCSGSRCYVGYNPVTIEWGKYQDEMEEEYPLTKGITLGYAKRFKLDSSSLPLYFEYGCNVSYMFGSYSYEFEGDYMGNYMYVKDDISVNFISANIPFNITVPIQVDNFTLMPYCGVNLRFNLLGSQDVYWEYKDDYHDHSGTETLDLFDKDLDPPFNRFQAGLNFGVNIEFNNYSVGIGRIKDFSQFRTFEDEEFGVSVKMAVTTISVGYKF